MRRRVRSAGGWCALVCVVTLTAWGCGSSDTNPFTDDPVGGQGGTSGSNEGGSTSGSNAGGSSNGGSSTGGASGSSTGGEENGGTSTGGNGDGGAAADAGGDSGGTTTGGNGGTDVGGAGGAGMGGTAGASMGGAGMSGAGMGGAGMSGAGMSGAGMAGTGGRPFDCKMDGDCDDDEYCKKASCDAESGNCAPVGPDCTGYDAMFAPVCGCDGTTFWNTCVLEHAGMNASGHGECTGNDRPTCTREEGGASCPSGGDHARCYRPMENCNDNSPLNGHCWVVPQECPDDEPQTTRYCGGTAGSARCIGLCEVLEAENAFFRDAPACD